MTCACGQFHTITLSNDGTAFCFGRNVFGNLGLGFNKNDQVVSLPTPIPNIPKMKMVSCGRNFTVCVDEDGGMWPFGENNVRQLGTKRNSNFPERIKDIPHVLSVSCGALHTLVITKEFNLWSCGHNLYGQLCQQIKKGDSCYLENTLFSNISRISAGGYHSLFQNKKGSKAIREKYLHVATINTENVDWVILVILKSYQVSFPIYLQILTNLFVGNSIVYFLIRKEVYFLLGKTAQANLVLVTIKIKMY